MIDLPYSERLRRCSQLMKEGGLTILLLTKPSNMLYLTGDGRLCSYSMITHDGKVAMGVPQTDVMDVKQGDMAAISLDRPSMVWASTSKNLLFPRAMPSSMGKKNHLLWRRMWSLQ